MEFEFQCSCCDEIHKGIPSFGTFAPIHYFSIPEEEIEKRVFLTSDTCVIDDEHFFVRGCLEIPVVGYDEKYVFGAWVSLSKANFDLFEKVFDQKESDHIDPMFGWFSSWVWPFYEDSTNIKSRIHLRNDGVRPFIELEPTTHPLALAQKNGITKDILIEIYEYYMHGKK
ncbi:MAG: DUF2199 domain-containing protein [Flavobacteriaceae bacterium]|nr:DUF2199 domain-containing protein [Flavobacteriaceae bacterium]